MANNDIQKADQVVHKFYTKLCLLVSSARITAEPKLQGKVDKWFNLETPVSDDDFKDHIRIYRNVSCTPAPPFELQVLLSIPELTDNQVLVCLVPDSSPVRIEPTPQHILLENWLLNFSPSYSLPLRSVPPRDVAPSTIYKQSIPLFRCLFSLLRMLPSWKLFRKIRRRLNTLNRNGNLSIQLRIKSLDNPLTNMLDFDSSPAPNTPPLAYTTHIFPSIPHPMGTLSLTATYLTTPNFQLDDLESLLTSKFFAWDEGPDFIPTLARRRQYDIISSTPSSPHHSTVTLLPPSIAGDSLASAGPDEDLLLSRAFQTDRLLTPSPQPSLQSAISFGLDSTPPAELTSHTFRNNEDRLLSPSPQPSSQGAISFSLDSAPPADLTPYISRKNDRYIAGGGFGDVYRCWYRRDSEKEVAVKAFRFSFALDGNSTNNSDKMLRRELGIWRRLKHDNIVPFLGIAYGFGMLDAMSLVSLWMPNGSLYHFLERHNDTLDLGHRFQFLLDITNGLHYLHSFPNPIVHGDLNGNNILLDGNYNARLADFGYASLVGNIPEALLYLQRSTARPGALRWIAPEQIESEETFTRTTKSDIYSLGCIALQVLSGKRPWSEVREDAAVILRLARGHKPGRPVCDTLQDAHWNMIQQCWSSVEERPPAGEIISSIQEFLSACPPFRPLCDVLSPRPSNVDLIADERAVFPSVEADTTTVAEDMDARDQPRGRLFSKTQRMYEALPPLLRYFDARPPQAADAFGVSLADGILVEDEDGSDDYSIPIINVV